MEMPYAEGWGACRMQRRRGGQRAVYGRELMVPNRRRDVREGEGAVCSGGVFVLARRCRPACGANAGVDGGLRSGGLSGLGCCVVEVAWQALCGGGLAGGGGGGRKRV